MQEGDDYNYESDDLDDGEGKLDAEGLRRLEEDQKSLLENEGEYGKISANLMLAVSVVHRCSARFIIQTLSLLAPTLTMSLLECRHCCWQAQTATSGLRCTKCSHVWRL